MQMPLGYASIPAPSLLEFHICRHFTKSLIWIEMQMPLGHILRINLQDLIGTSILLYEAFISDIYLQSIFALLIHVQFRKLLTNIYKDVKI